MTILFIAVFNPDRVCFWLVGKIVIAFVDRRRDEYVTRLNNSVTMANSL